MTLATPPLDNSTLTPEAQFEQDVQTVLTSAIAEHQQANLEDAERLYHIVLEVSPNHADANFNMGALLLERGKSAVAVAHFERAVAANPDEPRYWASYINALIQTGETGAAHMMLKATLQRGLTAAPLDAVAAHLATLTV
ncbi:tetratricopeptide repeat protein [Paraburkholderia fungorum]|uniref:tetratricopeptide repeat protein n=1 Tax=Paraburkholderia fungorum TaxID=134537 RepID=UPI0038BC8746